MSGPSFRGGPWGFDKESHMGRGSVSRVRGVVGEDRSRPGAPRPLYDGDYMPKARTFDIVLFLFGWRGRDGFGLKFNRRCETSTLD